MPETQRSWEDIIARMQENSHQEKQETEPQREEKPGSVEHRVERYLARYSSLVTHDGEDFKLFISQQDGNLHMRHINSNITYVFKLGARSPKFVGRYGEKPTMSQEVEKQMFEEVIKDVDAKMKRLEQEDAALASGQAD